MPFRKLRLPTPLSLGTFIWHRASFCEWEDFTRNEEVIAVRAIDEMSVPDIRFSTAENGVVVTYQRSGENAAVSNRIGHEVEAFIVSENEWGQLQYNGRFVDRDSGNWWYELHTCNIGQFVKPRPTCFLGSRPDHRFAELAKLR